MLEAVESLFYLALAAAFVVVTLRDRLESDPDPLEELRERYTAGKIDESEFEQELEFYVDDRNEQIRLVVEDIKGVGPDTSKAIAREFDSLDGLRAADRERLEDVYGVGEQTAEAVLERVRG